jgi:hypothetical protein
MLFMAPKYPEADASFMSRTPGMKTDEIKEAAGRRVAKLQVAARRAEVATVAEGDADALPIVQLRARACAVGGCTSFAELATVSLVRQFLRKGRRQDARRILRAFLQRHPSTPLVAELVRAIA